MLKTLPIIIALALALAGVSLGTHAEEKIITEADIEKAIERINNRIRAKTPKDDEFPKLTRVAIDYSNINGYLRDNRFTVFGAPYANGESDAKVIQLSTNIQFSKNFSGAFSLSGIDSDSAINQGNPATVTNSDSDGRGYGVSLRYQINNWLAAGAFSGWTNGDGRSLDSSPQLNSGSSKYTGKGKGVYLSATHVFKDSFVYSLSPSYTHNRSKTQSTLNVPGAAALVSSYTLTMWHIDQNLSFYFDENRARVTGGYTHHIVGTETNSSNAAREKASGSAYLGGSYLLSPKHRIELYGVVAKNFGDDVYDDMNSVTLGLAKNF